MANSLTKEISPYLLQHANNPVDWYPWGEEALERARREDKPIFLSIGYAACHWCHVMEHESFEDPETAALMNADFINIKVDREERPDLDSLYMQATTALTGSGGWPMSVFLTPGLHPFFAGTYFPPVRRYNLPSFRDVLISIAAAWREQREDVLHVSGQVLEHLRNRPGLPEAAAISPVSLETAAASLLEAYDWQAGGWGGAPKFPQPMAVEFLLRRAAANSPQRANILKAIQHALDVMSRGGMYDVVGGGFARYSVDNAWLTPHFEKMLCDNAQLALAYLHGFLVIQESPYRRVCESTLDFILREMTHPDGGFYSSLDADSDGEEGKFYVWTHDELRQILGPDFEFFQAAYGISARGNWDGRTILQRALDDASLASRLPEISRSTIPEPVAAKLAGCHARLLEARDRRIRPATDDKVLVSWNALMLTAFAEAGRYLQRQDYLDAAIRNARFLLTRLRVGGRLLRSWREGQAKQNAFLEDYAALTLALLALYQSDPQTEWYAAALDLANEMVSHFTDPAGGFFDTCDDHEILPVRPKGLQDNATPCGNSMAALALLKVASYEDRPRWRSLAEGMLAAIQPMALRNPLSFSHWLSALDFAMGPRFQIALVGDPRSPAMQEIRNSLWKTYRPQLVAAISPYPPAPGAPALLSDRPLLNGKPTAYVCRGFVCLQPVNSAAEMESQLLDQSGFLAGMPGLRG